MLSKKFKAKNLSAPAVPEKIYHDLLKILTREINQGLENIKQFATRQKVITYWNMGRAMADVFDRYGASQALYGRIAGETGLHPRTLQQCVQFFRAFPKIDFNLPLSWSHYRYLMTVEPGRKRERWMRRVLDGDLESNELRRLMAGDRTAAVAPAGTVASASAGVGRGRLYAYRIIKVDYVQDAPGGFVVDCGFEVRFPPPPCDGQVDNSRIVESRKTESGYSLKLSKATTAEIFTYKAIVERVVDGDTLLVNIDCGFDIWVRQRLRFRGIDAPEARALAGEKAIRWLKDELGGCPFVVIKTYKTDKYDRYLVDVFYRTGETDAIKVAAEGELLNLKMINSGFAAPWT